LTRRNLVRHLETHGCYLLKEGAKHSRYVNLAAVTRQATVPRHRQINDYLVRAICRQFGIPPP
jgi:predicted RNA binding protein YcfA (HicA-like mRNA interferase family)